MQKPDRGTGIARRVHSATLAWTFVILLALLSPGSDDPPLPDSLSWLPAHADKWVHGLLFFIETRFLVLSCRHSGLGLPPLATAIGAVAVLGALTEIAQIWVPDRSCEFADWIADLSGALAYGIWYHRPWRTGTRSSR